MNEMLKKYSKLEQELIIESGIKSLNVFKRLKIEKSIEKEERVNDYEIKRLKGINNKLRVEIDEIEEKTIKRKEIENNEINNIKNERICELKSIIAKLEEKINKMEKKELIILGNREKDIKMVTNGLKNEINEYKEQIKKLEIEIKSIKELHESNSKGSILESMVLKKCIEYNDNIGGNIWDIKDTSKLNHKGDIQFEHKYTKQRYLIDLKNYKGKVQKIEIEKIKKDILNKDNDVCGGMLISTDKISGKMGWEEENIEGKKLVYISDFKLCDIKLIFRELNRLCEISNIKTENIKKDEIIEENIKAYKKLNKWLIEIKNEMGKKKELHKTLVGGDIDMYIHEKIENKMDYDILENGYIRIGKRSKYYHKYMKVNGEKVIQYKGSKKSLEKWKRENNM